MRRCTYSTLSSYGSFGITSVAQAAGSPDMLCSLILLVNIHLLLHASPVYSVMTPAPAPRLLNVTTIAANLRNESVLECWQLTAPFVASLTAGVSGAAVAPLGETAATSFGVIPGRFDGGLHNAPAVQ